MAPKGRRRRPCSRRSTGARIGIPYCSVFPQFGIGHVPTFRDGMHWKIRAKIHIFVVFMWILCPSEALQRSHGWSAQLVSLRQSGPYPAGGDEPWEQGRAPLTGTATKGFHSTARGPRVEGRWVRVREGHVFTGVRVAFFFCKTILS